MKANFKWFNYLGFLYLTAASFTIKVTPAVAQGNVNFNSLNGLFTPTQSQRFFRMGREKFEREIEMFTNPDKYLNNNLLSIDGAAIEQMNEPHPNSILQSNPAQYNPFFVNIAE